MCGDALLLVVFCGRFARLLVLAWPRREVRRFEWHCRHSRDLGFSGTYSVEPLDAGRLLSQAVRSEATETAIVV